MSRRRRQESEPLPRRAGGASRAWLLAAAIIVGVGVWLIASFNRRSAERSDPAAHDPARAAGPEEGLSSAEVDELMSDVTNELTALRVSVREGADESGKSAKRVPEMTQAEYAAFLNYLTREHSRNATIAKRCASLEETLQILLVSLPVDAQSPELLDLLKRVQTMKSTAAASAENARSDEETARKARRGGSSE